MDIKSVGIILVTYGRASRLDHHINEMIRTAQYPFNLYFGVEDEDLETIKAVQQYGEVVPNTGRTSVSAQNNTYNKTSEEIVGIVSDDLEFTDGWLRKVIESFIEFPKIQLIANHAYSDAQKTSSVGCGTFIFRREYIEKFGAIDQPGVVFHPGYRHTFADEELWKTAIFRGVQLLHDGAWIIHHHWNQSPRYAHDDIYKRQEAWGPLDCEVFQKRRRMFNG